MLDFNQDIGSAIKELGKDKIACLADLFKKAEGYPPRVPRRRYRADNPSKIELLDTLEQSDHLISSDNKTEYYSLRPYALPLIDDKKAKRLVQIMCEAYDCLQKLYKEHLNEPVNIEVLLENIDCPKKDTLDAIHYMSEAHGVWVGKSEGFPYKEKSHINISEDTLIKDCFLEVLTDYYRWHFINPKEDISSSNINRLFKIDKKEVARFFTDDDISEHPAWFDKLGHTEKALIIEIDQALSRGLKALPVIGVRALLENLLVPIVEDKGTLENKLDRFIELGFITNEQKLLLSPVYHAGSAVMHRSYIPSPQSTKVCIEVIKHLLHGIYILKPEIDILKDEIPERRDK